MQVFLIPHWSLSYRPQTFKNSYFRKVKVILNVTLLVTRILECYLVKKKKKKEVLKSSSSI